MTREQKIKYLQMALSMQGITCGIATADAIIETYEELLVKEGSFTVSDAADIEFRVKQKYTKEKEVKNEC